MKFLLSRESVGLMIDSDLCNGCRMCEIACSFSDRKIFDPEKSSIKVWRKDDDYVFSLDPKCLTCISNAKKAGMEVLCVKYCAPKALTVI